MTKTPVKTSKKRPRKTPKGKPARAPIKPRKASAPEVQLAERNFQSALCFVGPSDVRIWGMTTIERMTRMFADQGIVDVLTLDEVAGRNGPAIFVREDAVIDKPLVPVLAKRPNLALADPSGDGSQLVAITIESSMADAAVALLQDGGLPAEELKLLVRVPGDLDSAFWKGLRKREVPYARLVTPENHAEIEWRMFMATYKGATDFVTKHVWPRPAFYMTRRLAETSVTPNMITAIGAICVVLAFWLFLEGQFIAGLIAAWLMTFLDTVDGKLARTTLSSSKWGDIFDHGIDLVHPPFWYVAWGYGLAVAGIVWTSSFLWLVIGAIFGGYIVQRLMEGISIKWLGLEIHIWRPVDTFFRQITARRNPNLVLLTLAAIVGRPDWGLIAVAAWTVLCLVLHGLQLVQAFTAKKQNGPLISWMSAPVRPK